ncbi:MAG: hypothetical protein M1814_000207 [Vezdaea aestivalis]|nr:MAG: hypothetical protein M1814_000207 [Vezdaea aestivalis]
MPPLSAASTWLQNSAVACNLQPRVLKDIQETGSHGWPPHQTYILRILATTASAFSVASAIIAFYWFVKMRRSFRHHLIMLLIQSDMLKALWYMIHPAVVLARGDIQTTSKFCQTSGFFIASSTEASDFAILMIAIHTALYIWKPSNSLGEGGLYPYRHIAYVLWVIFPALMASLAFVNPSYAYYDQGNYCYLPIRPYWYRVALSWIPRYIIFITITAVYIAIYVYVHFKFSSIGSKMDNSNTGEGATGDPDFSAEKSDNMSPTSPHFRDSMMLPSTPQLAYHGLLPPGDGSLGDPASREQSVASLTNGRPLSRGPDFENYSFAGLDSTLRTSDARSRDFEHTESARATPDTPDTAVGPDAPSRVGTLQVLRDYKNEGPSTPIHEQPQPDFGLSLVDSNGHDNEVDLMRQKRIAIRRQLRFLFIYPIVYMFMWIVPFISHCMQYTDYWTENPSFVLTCFVNVIVPLQCAVDCWLFSTREKPWRYIPGSPGTFTTSFLFWTHDRTGEAAGKSSVPTARHGPGKSRAEMAAEARVAYKRREEEMARSSEAIQERARERKASLARRGGRDKSWWDEEGKRRRDSVLMDSIPGGGIAEEDGETSEGLGPRRSMPALVLKMPSVDETHNLST